MAIARVIHKGRAGNPAVLKGLEDNLQEIVASALSTPEVALTKNDVALDFKGVGNYDDNNLMVFIHANAFPEHMPDIDSRLRQISEKIHGLLSPFTRKFGRSINGFVCLFPIAGSMAKF